MRITAVSEGLDPTIGYLHACRPGRVALVYDLMEPLRPIVDRVILGFVQKRVFSPGDFTLGSNGVCKVHSQLSKAIVQVGVGKDALTRTMGWFLQGGLAARPGHSC